MDYKIFWMWGDKKFEQKSVILYLNKEANIVIQFDAN